MNNRPYDRHLHGDRSQCPTCFEYFNSSSTFAKHRVGPYTNGGTDRRCLTVEEMQAKGWSFNSFGFWRTKVRSPAAPARSSQRQSGDPVAQVPDSQEAA